MANQSDYNGRELVIKIVLYKNIFMNIATLHKTSEKTWKKVEKLCRDFNKNFGLKNYTFNILDQKSSENITVLKLEDMFIKLKMDLRRLGPYKFELDEAKIVGYRFPGSVLKIFNLFVEFGSEPKGTQMVDATDLLQLMKHDKIFSKLGDSLAPDAVILHERQKAVSEIVDSIKQSANISVDRVIVSGSTGRNTNIGRQFDYDLILFVNNVEPPYKENCIRKILQIVTSKHGLHPNFDCTTSPITVKLKNWRGTDMDILCTPNLSSKPNVQWERAVEKMKMMEPEERWYWLASVAEKTVEFMKKLDVWSNRVARVVKLMVHGWVFAEKISKKSYVIELLAVYASQNMISMGLSIAKFLDMIANAQNIQVSFGDDTAIISGPCLIYPANPHNDLHKYLAPHIRDLRQFAEESLTMMKQGLLPIQFRVSEQLPKQPFVGSWHKWIVDNQTGLALEECTPIEDNCSPKLCKAQLEPIRALHSMLVMEIYK